MVQINVFPFRQASLALFGSNINAVKLRDLSASRVELITLTAQPALLAST